MATKAKPVTLDKYDDVFLECRDLRHSWVKIGAWQEGTLIKRKLQCQRCLTHRTDTWSAKADRVRQNYMYPVEYQISGGVTTKKVRAEVIQRTTVYASEDQMIDAVFTKKKGRK